MERIYELRYVNGEEIYYTCGYFSTFEKAKEQLRPDNIEKILSVLPFVEEDADYQKFEIYEQKIDEVRDCNWKEKYSATFESKYDEDKDEYLYELTSEND